MYLIVKCTNSLLKILRYERFNLFFLLCLLLSPVILSAISVLAREHRFAWTVTDAPKTNH